MKKALIVAVVGLGVLGGGIAFWFQHQRQVRREFVLKVLPTMAHDAGTPAFRSRLSGAIDRAKSEGDGTSGLAEASRLYHANGYLAEAARCYEGLERLQPSEAVWWHRQAAIFAGYGDDENALPLWQKTVELAPDYIPARLRLADVELKTNRVDEAKKNYDDVLQRDPGNPYADLGLARIDWEAGRLEPAKTRLQRVVERTHYELGYDLIVSVDERLGLIDQANAVRAQHRDSGAFRDADDPWLDSLMDDCYDPFRLLLAAGNFERSGKIDTAVTLLRRAAELSPQDVRPVFQLGLLYLHGKDLVAAAREFERCTQIAPTFADGWAQLAGALSDRGDIQGAVRTVINGLGSCPDSPGLHLMRARQLEDSEENAEAIEELKTSIRLRPNAMDPYLELGKLLIKTNRVDEGVEQLQLALVAEPDNPSALSILAFHAISTGNRVEARNWMDRVHRQPRVPAAEREQLEQAYQQAFGSS